MCLGGFNFKNKENGAFEVIVGDAPTVVVMVAIIESSVLSLLSLDSLFKIYMSAYIFDFLLVYCKICFVNT